jgi:hypothetical protein
MSCTASRTALGVASSRPNCGTVTVQNVKRCLFHVRGVAQGLPRSADLRYQVEPSEYQPGKQKRQSYETSSVQLHCRQASDPRTAYVELQKNKWADTAQTVTGFSPRPDFRQPHYIVPSRMVTSAFRCQACLSGVPMPQESSDGRDRCFAGSNRMETPIQQTGTMFTVLAKTT